MANVTYAVWDEWNSGGTTASCYTSSTTWTSWNTDTSATTTWTYWNDNSTYNTTDSTWVDWNTDDHVYRQRTMGEWVQPVVELTEEQKAAEAERLRLAEVERQRQLEEFRKRNEELQRKGKEAEARARETLEDLLDEDQQKDLKEKSFFLVSVKSGNKYRIRKGRTGNVERIDDKGKTIEKLCVHPRLLCPDYDTMLTQKLMLEDDEEAIRKVANISRY